MNSIFCSIKKKWKRKESNSQKNCTTSGVSLAQTSIGITVFQWLSNVLTVLDKVNTSCCSFSYSKIQTWLDVQTLRVKTRWKSQIKARYLVRTKIKCKATAWLNHIHRHRHSHNGPLLEWHKYHNKKLLSRHNNSLLRSLTWVCSKRLLKDMCLLCGYHEVYFINYMENQSNTIKKIKH